MGRAWPIYVNSGEGETDAETKTTISGPSFAFTEYTTSVLKKLYDQQAAIDTKMPVAACFLHQCPSSFRKPSSKALQALQNLIVKPLEHLWSPIAKPLEALWSLVVRTLEAWWSPTAKPLEALWSPIAKCLEVFWSLIAKSRSEAPQQSHKQSPLVKLHSKALGTLWSPIARLPNEAPFGCLMPLWVSWSPLCMTVLWRTSHICKKKVQNVYVY